MFAVSVVLDWYELEVTWYFNHVMDTREIARASMAVQLKKNDNYYFLRRPNQD